MCVCFVLFFFVLRATPDGLEGPYVVSEIELRLDTYKTSALLTYCVITLALEIY